MGERGVFKFLWGFFTWLFSLFAMLLWFLFFSDLEAGIWRFWVGFVGGLVRSDGVFFYGVFSLAFCLSRK
jgi:hypothetical protein